MFSPEIVFFHLRSICTSSRKAFFLSIRSGSPGLALPGISLFHPSASDCAGVGIPAVTLSLSLLPYLFFNAIYLSFVQMVFTSCSVHRCKFGVQMGEGRSLLCHLPRIPIIVVLFILKKKLLPPHLIIILSIILSIFPFNKMQIEIKLFHSTGSIFFYTS